MDKQYSKTAETSLNESSKKRPKTFTDISRIVFKGILDPIAGFLNRVGLKPNTITLLGLIGQMIGAYYLATGRIMLGGIIVLFMAPIDALDGTMARLRGESTTFGAFIDSVTDRYSEAVVFLGLLIYYLQQPNHLIPCILVYLSAAGSMLVSYTRSRAETLGFDAKIGLLSRLERYLILIPSLIFNRPLIALWILGIFTNLTAIQRILHVRNQFWTQQAKKE
jgi:CDP-diacylglycerol---glycerol-3-phosphate 3-phosphatidyltransferase